MVGRKRKGQKEKRRGRERAGKREARVVQSDGKRGTGGKGKESRVIEIIL